jgi:hypothetical protein
MGRPRRRRAPTHVLPLRRAVRRSRLARPIAGLTPVAALGGSTGAASSTHPAEGLATGMTLREPRSTAGRGQLWASFDHVCLRKGDRRLTVTSGMPAAIRASGLATAPSSALRHGESEQNRHYRVITRLRTSAGVARAGGSVAAARRKTSPCRAVSPSLSSQPAGTRDHAEAFQTGPRRDPGSACTTTRSSDISAGQPAKFVNGASQGDHERTREPAKRVDLKYAAGGPDSAFGVPK